MNRRTLAVIGILLIVTWVAVFFVTRIVIDMGEPEVEFEGLPSATPRPPRTDVPEIQAGVPTPTVMPIEDIQATAIAQLTLSPIDINLPEDERPEGLPEGTMPPDGAYPIRLAVPRLGIIAAVLVVQTDENFNIVTPRDEVGFYALSSKIGGGGNSVMIGHVYPGRIFNNLLDAQIGDTIRITDQFYNEHWYMVEEIRRVPYEIADEDLRTDSFNYIYDDSKERITLVTCYPEYEWTHRFVVRAVPIDAPDTGR